MQEEDSRGRASLAESIKTPEEKTDEAVLAKSRSWGFLKEAEAGFPVKEVCRQMVSEAIHFRWINFSGARSPGLTVVDTPR